MKHLRAGVTHVCLVVPFVTMAAAVDQAPAGRKPSTCVDDSNLAIFSRRKSIETVMVSVPVDVLKQYFGDSQKGVCRTTTQS